MTLASIVEKETAKPEERPIVAAVYANRLRIGMALQCDPTVIYALQRAGRSRATCAATILSFDSPYNTYRYPGLPPGPIASPGNARRSKRVVQPADGDYVYFVSRNDGSHEFARTLEEHNRNVQKFQVHFRDKRLQLNRAVGQWVGGSGVRSGAGGSGWARGSARFQISPARFIAWYRLTSSMPRRSGSASTISALRAASRLKASRRDLLVEMGARDVDRRVAARRAAARSARRRCARAGSRAARDGATAAGGARGAARCCPRRGNW